MPLNLLLLCLGLLLTFGATAQQRGQRAPQGQGTAEERATAMLERYRNELSLTDEQVMQVKEISKHYTEAMAELRGDGNPVREQHMTAIRTIQNKRDADILALLTEEQQKKFAAMQERQDQNMRQPRSGRGSARN